MTKQKKEITEEVRHETNQIVGVDVIDSGKDKSHMIKSSVVAQGRGIVSIDETDKCLNMDVPGGDLSNFHGAKKASSLNELSAISVDKRSKCG
ncbi:hypothetical protein V6x_16370 [Gimesia chilikensis]|uniref:Uncharacterized protein n=1 Tax=Gimesia chilikensis TaxID=2605989 RepID=A0A517W9M6_9PLAN|nr:hypothetical protein [Gimesia chilikensis]QDU01954.1 hypothetical protein V6x_16370 [Gimesia chilikensis]